MAKFAVTITLTEPILGTAPLNKELYAEYIATKMPDNGDASDEIETVEEMTEKGTTGFHRPQRHSPQECHPLACALPTRRRPLLLLAWTRGRCPSRQSRS